ncbi:integrase [Streptomyces sp. NPDC051776]|uniref:integrase n=1 Tax=Streptomyces sp. NPDC051776 TaxID=3155414 RepID=UPI00343EADA4
MGRAAGNGVPVLLATYARCISGQLKDHQRRIEAGGELPALAAEAGRLRRNVDTYSTEPPA